MDDARTSILFLCTGNSARSILAEAIANGRYGEALAAQSAGAKPHGEAHPVGLETLRRHGLDTAGLRSKGIDEMAGRTFDLVLTLCDEAAEACPAFAGAALQAHWSLPDPPLADVPAVAFEAVYEALSEAIGLLARGPGSLRERAAGGEAAVRRALHARAG